MKSIKVKSLILFLSLLLIVNPLAESASYAKAKDGTEAVQPAKPKQRDFLIKQYGISDEEIQALLDQGYRIQDIEKALRGKGKSKKKLTELLEEISPKPVNLSKDVESKIVTQLGATSFSTMAAMSVVPDYSYVKTKPDEAPFTINAGQETVSTLSGSLSQSVVDMTLPGRNGLGFALTRKYDSGDSQLNQMSVYGGVNTTIQPADEKQFPLGKGWSWDISFIETSGSDKFLHLSGSGVFKIGSDNSLTGYPWKDLTFAPDTSVTVAGVASAYSLKSIQKISQYFNTDGQLIQISDSYDNKVTFTYSTHPLYGSTLSSITDAIGNAINITYSENSVVLAKGTQTVTYYKVTQNGKELLSKVIDPIGRETTYDYSIQDALFNLLGTTPSTSNPYALLTGVTYPTGGKSVYTYESSPITRFIGENAVNQAYRVKSREDQFSKSDGSIEKDNHKNINYSGDIGSANNADITYSVTFDDGLVHTTFTNEKDYIDENNPPVFYNTQVLSTTTSNVKTYNNRTDYSYDRARKWPVPITTTITKSESGNSNNFVQSSSLMYDDYGNVLSSTDPMNVQTTYIYDSTSHLLVGISRPISSTQTQYTEYVRDAIHGNVITTRVREGSSTGAVLSESINSGYDAYGNVTQLKILRNVGEYTTVDIEYNPAAPFFAAFPTKTLVTVKDIANVPSTIVKEYSYNTSNGSLLTYKDGNNKITQYQYDALGRAIRVTNPDNSFGVVQYYDYSNEIQQVDETGVVTYARFNPIGLKIDEGFVERGTYKSKGKYTYDAYGRLLQSEDALGNVTQFGYDQWSRQSSVTYPGQASESIQIDDISNTMTSIDAEGYQIKEYFDKLGRTLKTEETKKLISGAGTQTNTLAIYSYDFASNLRTTTEYATLTNTSTYAYNALDQLIGVTNANNETTSYQYDFLGSLLQTVFPDNNIKSNKYDEIGRLIQTTDTNNKVEQFYYDNNGNQIKLKDRNGNRFKYTYNSRNLQTTKEIVDASWNPIVSEETITFGYDLAGRRTQMVDTTGTTGYNYEAATGALTGIIYPDLKTISYDYDAAGNRIAMKDPFGYNTYYQYDQRNRLDTVAASFDFANDYDVKYQYYSNNLLKQSRQGNGVTSDYKYDGLQIGELIEKKSNGTVINSYSYASEMNGNQLQKTENGTQNSFVYDALNRVINSSQFNETYGYDNRGNRTSLTTDKPFESPGTGYVYDKRDRLISVTVGASAVTYKYNGAGLLWERTENGQTTRYYWDGDQVIAEATVSGGVATFKARYVRGQSLVAREDEQGKAYYLQNGHGDVVELRDESGDTRLNQYTYDIFGNIVSQSEFIPQPFKYSGEMTDNTTSLQYLRSRWYDPSIGRFINEDAYKGQIDNPLSLNLYTYVENNPLIYSDPTGRSKKSDSDELAFLLTPFSEAWKDADTAMKACVAIECASYYAAQKVEAEMAADAFRVSYYASCFDDGNCSGFSNIPDDVKYRGRTWDMYVESKYGNVHEMSFGDTFFAVIGFIPGEGTALKTGWVMTDKALKQIMKKWGKKGVEVFEKAANKGSVGPKGESGIKKINPISKNGKTYTHEIKVSTKEQGDYRVFGYKDEKGNLIFDYFDKGLH